MKKMTLLLIPGVLFFLGCSSLPSTERFEQNEHRIRSLAVLPLVVGDREGRIIRRDDAEVAMFMEYWNKNFYKRFENRIYLKNGVKLLLPGRDFYIEVGRDMNYSRLLRELNVDAILVFNLTSYNEVGKNAQGGQAAAAVILKVVGNVDLPTEECLSGYEMHFYYLDVEDWHVKITSHLERFLEIDEQRNAHLGNVLNWLDENFPLSINFDND